MIPFDDNPENRSKLPRCPSLDPLWVVVNQVSSSLRSYGQPFASLDFKVGNNDLVDFDLILIGAKIKVIANSDFGQYDAQVGGDGLSNLRDLGQELPST